MKSGIISPESAKAIFGSLSIVLGMCTRFDIIVVDGG